MKNVLVIGNISEKTKEEFSEIEGYRFRYFKNKNELTESDLAEAEVIIGGAGEKEVALAPKLKWIQTFSAGANNYKWLDEKVMLTNAYGAYGDSIAEHMLAITLMAMKRLPDYLEGQKEQKWELLHDISRFEGSKVVVVGMGAIGSAYAKRAHALGASVSGVKRTVHDQPDYVEKLCTTADMDALFADADVVALSLPSTDETAGLFDYERLHKIRKGAILINVGRGSAIVTDDLVETVKEGHFKAVCLDTMAPEPLPEGHPLWTLPNVYITPHISGGFRAGVNYESVISVVKENLRRVARGEEPVHVVDRKLGY